MSKPRKKYSREFKLEALALSKSSGKSDAEIERDLGLSPGMVYRWKQQLVADGEQAFRGNGQMKAEEAQLRQLQRENEVLRQERDIGNLRFLKKALSIFSQAPR